MSEHITMRAGNRGLTVKINLFAMKDLEWFDSKTARLWMRGQATNADTRQVEKFNDGGELISILGKWNAQKFRQLKAIPKKPNPN
jgi:hypothetical protein